MAYLDENNAQNREELLEQLAEACSRYEEATGVALYAY